MEEKEVWEIIEDFPNYSISSFGVIWNTKQDKPTTLEKSYTGEYESYRVRLYKNGCKGVRFAVHRLVAMYFIPNLEGKPNINHKDGNSLNNKVSNLEWCTQKENIHHSRHISKNGSVISAKKIKVLNSTNPNLTKGDFIKLLLDNCK